MDMSKSIEPKSDQINADDLVAGPVTVTIASVSQGNAEQPVNVELEQYPGRPFRPSKSMRRVLVAAWGKNASAYVGHSLTLYRDPTVKFAGEEVGGIRISHMSGIEKPMEVALTVTRGKRQRFTVKPLEVAPNPAQPDPIEESLNASWDDTERMKKAVEWMANNSHPLHDRAAERLAELEAQS